MSIRRKRRQRGKRKEIRKQAMKAWKQLSDCNAVPAVDSNYLSIVLPMIRQLVPLAIANDLVSVQPIASPTGTLRKNYDQSKKTIQEQRKAERKAKNRRRADVAKTQRIKRKSIESE